ncbi:uncharacterized protein LOC143282181 [Babylonia areolata]|uniref:uncharacterized protein LOC143282181 n=1 Tax=Babylonia areolata TaxID=304850 RepID=UPI003FCF8327
MTTTQPHRAIILDLHSSSTLSNKDFYPHHPSSSSSSSSPHAQCNHNDHLHHSSSSSSSPSSSTSHILHADLLGKSLNDIITKDQQSSTGDLVQLYLLARTGTAEAGSTAALREDLLASREEEGWGVRVTVVEAEERIASFYRAKQHLDHLGISRVTLVTRDAAAEQFWTLVCRELFTPVHEWQVVKVEVEVEVVVEKAVKEETQQVKDFLDRARTTSNHLTPGNSVDDDDSDLDDGEESSLERDGDFNNTESSSLLGDNFNTEIPSTTLVHGTESASTRDDLKTDKEPAAQRDSKSGEKRSWKQDDDNDNDVVPFSGAAGSGSGSESGSEERSKSVGGFSAARGCSSSSSSTVTADSVRAEIRGFLKTLPSLLALPEADRSPLLPGEAEGFVHGFSTRRGGVTSLPTLCSMNLLYTDKKRDPPLVVEENRRRLALVGGFDPQTFHIVKVEHGHRVWTVGEEEPPLKYDALVTNRRDVTLAAAGADCIPLLFADPVTMAIGAAHAGWLGSVKRVAGCVVETMRDRFGCRPEDIRVCMGPGIRLGCFRVLEEEGKMFADIHPSCQVDVVRQLPVCHKIEETRLQGEGSSRGCDDEMSGGFLGEDVSCRPASWTGEKSEEVRTVRGAVAADRERTLLPRARASEVVDGRVTPQASQEEEVAVADGRIMSSDRSNSQGDREGTARSEHPLADLFRVQEVPAERLRPQGPQQKRKSSRLQWTFVDLQMTNYHVLLQAGVKAEHIDMSTSHCTKCNPRLYFSYERDGFPFGNQIGFISMPSRLSA